MTNKRTITRSFGPQLTLDAVNYSNGTTGKPLRMCSGGHTDTSLLAFMPFWYRKWKRDKDSSRK
jgi:hypothetical protein